MISKAIRQASEVKFFDWMHINGPIVADMATTINDDLFHPPQGVKEQERVGNKIRIQSIQLRGELNFEGTSAVGTEYAVRIILYQYHPMSNGTSAPLLSNLLSSAGATTSMNVYAPILPNQMHDYTIVFDRTFTLASSDSPYHHKRFSLYITKFPKYFDRSIKFAGNTSVDGHNKIYFAALSNCTNVNAAEQTKLRYWTRTRFLDD